MDRIALIARATKGKRKQVPARGRDDVPSGTRRETGNFLLFRSGGSHFFGDERLWRAGGSEGHLGAWTLAQLSGKTNHRMGWAQRDGCARRHATWRVARIPGRLETDMICFCKSRPKPAAARRFPFIQRDMAGRGGNTAGSKPRESPFGSNYMNSGPFKEATKPATDTMRVAYQHITSG